MCGFCGCLNWAIVQKRVSASLWCRFTLRLHLCHFESLQAVVKPSAFVATSDLHSGWKPGAEHVQQLIARAPTLGATDPLERRGRVRALSAEERELEAAAVDLERLEHEDENYFGFFGFCSGVRHRGPCAEAEQQRASIATGATAFARQAGSRCATLPLPAHDSCGTRPGGDIISVLCAGRETRSCRRAVRQKRMPRYRASQKWPSPAGIVAGERRERLGSAQLVLGANG